MEGDAGSGQLDPTPTVVNDTDDITTTEDDSTAAVEETATSAPAASEAVPLRRTRSRLASRGWAVGVCATLVVLAAATAAGGYFALRSHHVSADIARADDAAMAAAKDCVTATQAPDTSAMEASQRKIIDCSTGDFRVQATLYTGMLVDAYQVANAQVQVSDMRAAVERHNDDGSIDVLVALRVALSNSTAQNQDTGYRLRVTMAPDSGTYKIARLDQVTK
jgi:Mce-associated membrane protein